MSIEYPVEYNRRYSDKKGDKFAIGMAIHGFTVFMEYSMPPV